VIIGCHFIEAWSLGPRNQPPARSRLVIIGWHFIQTWSLRPNPAASPAPSRR
jgi:hypothetical protein